MTTVIDHAIAIPTRPSVVWDVIRDISNNSAWQSDSQRVQFLTTARYGRGMRWRNTNKANKEQVIEITAWYEGLGYEYRIVDGSVYPNNRGRIRLQESPEGTVVQWSFSYDVNGLFGGLRNNFGLKGRADKQIVEGLKKLYVFIKDSKADEQLIPEESKSYLQEAPNVQERASYQPRYPIKTKSQEMRAIQVDTEDRFKPPAEHVPTPLIEEPPLADEDTRPNPAIAASEPVAEPSFLESLPADSVSSNSLPTIDSALEEETVRAVDETADETLPTLPRSQQKATPVSNEIGLSERSTQENEAIADVPLTDEGANKATLESITPNQDVSKLDTAKISVFELFGLEKPSETEQVVAIRTTSTGEILIPEPPRSFMDSAPIIPDVQPERHTRRRGLRASLRSQLKRIRVPKYE